MRVSTSLRLGLNIPQWEHGRATSQDKRMDKKLVFINQTKADKGGGKGGATDTDILSGLLL